MKKFTLTIIILLAMVAVNAQNGRNKTTGYESIFGKDTTSWNVVWDMFDGLFTAGFYPNGYAVINGTEYRAINCNPMITRTPFYVREDTLEGKVWIWDENVTKERLIMNMQMQKGDTFLLAPYYLYEQTNDSVAVVDTVFEDENGRKHIGFDFAVNHWLFQQPQKLEFIEGTGATYGLVYQLQEDEFFSFDQEILLCAFKDGSKTYFHPEYPDTCSMTIVGVKEISQRNDCRLYPNPGNNVLCLQTLLKNADFELYDITGRRIVQQKIDRANTIINTSALLPGMYFYRFTLNGEVKESGKWVKE